MMRKNYDISNREACHFPFTDAHFIYFLFVVHLFFYFSWSLVVFFIICVNRCIGSLLLAVACGIKFLPCCVIREFINSLCYLSCHNLFAYCRMIRLFCFIVFFLVFIWQDCMFIVLYCLFTRSSWFNNDFPSSPSRRL